MLGQPMHVIVTFLSKPFPVRYVMIILPLFSPGYGTVLPQKFGIGYAYPSTLAIKGLGPFG